MPFGSIELQDGLKRLIALNGTDEGFYVLALHSLIEAYANQRSTYISTLETFGRKMDELFRLLGRFDPAREIAPQIVRRLTQEHSVTNRVRHDFQELSPEEARTATFNFLQFCEAVGWDDPLMSELQEALELWKGKKTPLQQYREMRKLRLDYNRLKEEKSEADREIEESRDSRAALEQVKNQLRQMDQELGQLRETAARRKEKSTQLRQRLRAAEEEKKELLERAERLQAAELYMSYLERFTAYTRTRSDYERTVLQLSPEQKKAASRIGEQGDYLVHGSAGTGKTFVLLHALDQELDRRDQELGVTPSELIVLLTYTRTLVRFDEYLTAIVGRHRRSPDISTVDAFVIQRLQRYDGRFFMDYDALKGFTTRNDVSFLSPEELYAEIEDVIFGRGLRRETYVEASGARRGMKQPLSAQQRDQVWSIAQDAKATLLHDFRLSKNLSRLLLWELLENDATFREEAMVGRLFIDEVQDLAPIELQALKLLSRSGVVLAGDEQQAIYQAGMSFKRLGIDVVGHATVLTTNYRNTRQIAMFGHLLQALWNPTGDDVTRAPEAVDAHREGPTPELWTHQRSEDSERALVKRVNFFVSVLGYEPENIAVLVPFGKQADRVSELLKETGYETRDIRATEFDFEKTRGVRVSTLHSAKGVEFPVVMLLIPYLATRQGMDSGSDAQQRFNLIYVAVTRAMDNLQIFLTDDNDDELVALLKRGHAALLEQERAEDEAIVSATDQNA